MADLEFSLTYTGVLNEQDVLGVYLELQLMHHYWVSSDL